MYCIKDNWENWPNVRHTRDRIYLTSVLAVQFVNQTDRKGKSAKDLDQWEIGEDGVTDH